MTEHPKTAHDEDRRPASPLETNQLLLYAQQGDGQARARLFSHVYNELQRLARSQRRKALGDGLQTTELVHEAYLKLCQADRLSAADRSHFLSIAASAMRQILVDHFRRLSAAKRGGHDQPLTLDEVVLQRIQDGPAVLAVDEALQRFTELDGRAAQVVELKFFAGMTETEIAEALGISIRTVSGDWRRARAWLNRELSG